MKIADVKVGELYVALDSPTSSRRGRMIFSSGSPRPVKVLEIVTIEVKSYSHYTSRFTLKKIKRVVIEATEDPRKGMYRARGLDALAKGETLTVEARQLVGLWSDLKEDILEGIEKERAKDKAREDENNRILGLGFVHEQFSYALSGLSWEPELKFYGADVVERVLEALEGQV